MTGAEIARRVGVSRQVFHHRAVKYGFPRLPDRTYDLEATTALWHDTTRGNGHGGARRNAGAKARLAMTEQRSIDETLIEAEQAAVEQLDQALVEGAELSEQQLGLLNVIGSRAAGWLAWIDLVAPHLAQRLEYPDAERLGAVLAEEGRRWCRVFVGASFRQRNPP